MARAEITFEPSAKHEIAKFFMRMVVTQPKTDIFMKADASGITFTCGDKALELPAERD